jgi:hypothetical protein
MSDCALRAVWGNPLNTSHAVTPAGETTRYVFGPSHIVNLVNGHVTSVQY